MSNTEVNFISSIKSTFFDSIQVAIKVYKTIIPVTILIQILLYLDLVKYFAIPLEPIMALVGLPAEYGIAWAVAMFVNIYSALIVIMGLLPQLGLPSVAEASTFSVMVLMAHGLLIESKISQTCGVSFWVQFFFRIFAAIISGIILHGIYSLTGFHSQAATMLLEVNQDRSLQGIIINELNNLVRIFFIIWAVLFLHLWLTKFNIISFMEKILSPLLNILGMSQSAASTIIVGFSAGIVYGGGLIIQESKAGKMSKKDLFCAISLMGICHALIEDTFLLMLIGGSPWVTLVYRFIMSLIIGIILSFTYDFFVSKKGKDLEKA